MKASGYPTDTGTFWELGMRVLPFQGEVWGPQAEQTRGRCSGAGNELGLPGTGSSPAASQPQGPGGEQECGTLSIVPAQLSPNPQV